MEQTPARVCPEQAELPAATVMQGRANVPPGEPGRFSRPPPLMLGQRAPPPPRGPVFFGRPAPQPAVRFPPPGVRPFGPPGGFPGRMPFPPQLVRGPAVPVRPPPPPPPPPPPAPQIRPPQQQVSVEEPAAVKPEEEPSSVKGFDDGQPKPLLSSPSTPSKSRASEAPDEPKAADAENDSGVDESTQQRREAAHKPNGLAGTTAAAALSPTKKKSSLAGSPVKSPSKSASKSALSRTLAAEPSLLPPSTAPGERKKVPMNKVQVGAAPSPNLKAVRSKIGSLDNTTYKPGGGKVKIENRKLDFSKAQPKIAAKNDKYTPSGGDKKIQQVKLQWNAKPKIGSLENAAYKPGGGDKKIETVKLDFKDKAKPKVGSKENAKHVPGGGAVKSTATPPKTPQDSASNIETQKLDIKAESKIGSLDNVKHKPGGGDKKIFDDKTYLRQTSSSNVGSVSGSGSQSPIPSGTGSISDKNGLPMSDENLNQEC